MFFILKKINLILIITQMNNVECIYKQRPISIKVDMIVIHEGKHTKRILAFFTQFPRVLFLSLPLTQPFTQVKALTGFNNFIFYFFYLIK
jgi:hypothetical protein